MQNEDGETVVTREWLELRMRAMRSELRLLVALSITLNQFASHVELPQTVGYIGGAAVVAGILLKIASTSRLI